MKVTTTKEQLVGCATLAERIAGKKETLPVLSCILIEAGKELIVRSTNLESGIEVQVPAEISEKGTVAVSAAVFAQVVRSIGSDKITLSLEENNLLITSRGTKTLVKAVPHTEFPILPSSTQQDKVIISRDSFVKGLQSTVYASSTSMIRPELGSVYVAIHTEKMLFAATDSFRLAEKTVAGVVTKQETEILIPLKHVGELIYVLERVSGDRISFGSEESQLVVEVGLFRYISRVVEGQFPNYKEIIPKQFTAEATMLKSEFAEMLKKARVFAGSEQHIGLHVYPKQKLFTATARSEAVGEMSDSIDAALSGDDVDINFHLGYLGDCLSSIDSDSITLGFSGVGRPLVIKGTTDASFMYLVMPLNR